MYSMPLQGFEKMYDTALKMSTEQENVVFDVVADLRMKGYNPCEILDSLTRFKKKLIQDEEIEYVNEAVEEIEGWCVRDLE